MATALVPSLSDKLSSARAFARSLNILLKHARLYGLGHKRSADQFDQAWTLLRSVLSGETGFLFGVSGNKLLLDGIPMECGPSEQTFAKMLAIAGISSIHFSQKISANDFQLLVETFANARPADLLATLQSSVNELPSGGIKVNEVRFVAHDGAEGEPGSIASAITARTLTQLGPQVTDWLKDPKRLLQMISAVNGMHGGHGDGPNGTGGGDGNGSGIAGGLGTGNGVGEGEGTGGSGSGKFLFGSDSFQVVPAWDDHPVPLKEEEVVSVLRFLARMGALKEQDNAPPDSAVLQHEMTQMNGNAQTLLYQTLFTSVASSFDGQSEMPDLLKLAEHLAIKFAVESFERGEVKVNAVQQMLERMNGELDTLRRVLNAHEDKMSRAGMLVESHGEILDRQFWSAVPDWGKKNVLLSDDGWCIPPRNVRSYVEQLLERRDTQTATAILVKYLDAVESKDPEARRKTSSGIVELADLYGRTERGLLQQAILRVGRQLAVESTLELQTMFSAAFVRLNQEASSKRDYIALEQSLCSLARIEKTHPKLAGDIKPRVSVQSRMRDFIAEINDLQSVPQGLVDVLRRSPAAAAEEIANQFNRCTTRQVAENYMELLEKVGAPAIEHLQELLTNRQGSEAILGIGLLSRFEPQMLVDQLPGRLNTFARQHQDSIVRQIASAGAPHRGQLLLHLIDSLDPMILPEAIDEISLNGCEASYPALLELARGEGAAKSSKYAQLKAIEAVGRLAIPGAETQLSVLLIHRTMFGYAEPRELRVAAMQALQKINPERARLLMVRSGLEDWELDLRPLEPTQTKWVRQRRYPRVVPSGHISATAIMAKGKSPIALESVSLGGGFASRQGRGQFGSEALLEMQTGFRPIRSRVLIREGAAGMCFEIADIDMDERSKLRKFIAAQMR